MQESYSRGVMEATAPWGTILAKNALCQLLWYCHSSHDFLTSRPSSLGHDDLPMRASRWDALNHESITLGCSHSVLPTLVVVSVSTRPSSLGGT